MPKGPNYRIFLYSKSYLLMSVIENKALKVKMWRGRMGQDKFRCYWIITGRPNGPVLFCSLASVVVVCRCRLSSSVTLPAAGRVGGRPLPGRARGIFFSACRVVEKGEQVQRLLPQHLAILPHFVNVTLPKISGGAICMGFVGFTKHTL